MKRSRINPINRRRRGAEFRRCYGSNARRAAIAAMPCCNCGRGPCDNHHTQSGGIGRKGDWTSVVPLCRVCHRTWHRLGSNARFLEHTGVDLEAVARRLAKELPADLDTLEE